MGLDTRAFRIATPDWRQDWVRDRALMLAPVCAVSYLVDDALWPNSVVLCVCAGAVIGVAYWIWFSRRHHG